jgi:hypothetical protein
MPAVVRNSISSFRNPNWQELGWRRNFDLTPISKRAVKRLPVVVFQAAPWPTKKVSWHQFA